MLHPPNYVPSLAESLADERRMETLQITQDTRRMIAQSRQSIVRSRLQLSLHRMTVEVPTHDCGPDCFCWTRGGSWTRDGRAD